MKQSPGESNALSSFRAILNGDPAMASHFSLVIYDNSAESHQIAEDSALHYVHDPANGGLAAAYNYALSRAEDTGYERLLLLDQDTTLTSEFLAELIDCAHALRTEDNVAANCPQADGAGNDSLAGGTLPRFHPPSISKLCPHVRLRGRWHSAGRISAYNSGSTLNVRMLRSIGGFPSEFWLDYLDHAVFDALAAKGYRVYVLHAVLQHELAESDLNARPIWRFRNVLQAQSLFVKRTGSLRPPALSAVALAVRPATAGRFAG